MCVALWLWPWARARAADDECAVVDGLSELRPRERDALRTLCGGGVPDPLAAVAGVFRVMSLPGYRAAALARVFAPRADRRQLVIQDPRAPEPPSLAAQRRLAALPAKLAAAPLARDCAELRATIDRHLAAVDLGEAAAPPFLHDDPALLRCLGLAAPLPGSNLVGFRADNVTSLLVVASTPDLTTATWLGPDDLVAVGSRRFFVAAVPPAALVLAVGRVRNVTLPAVWRGLVTYDQSGWTEPTALTCVTLDVDLGKHGALFIDGTAVASVDREVARTVAVTRDDHQLVVMECPPGRACHIRYQDVLAGKTLQTGANECRAVRLDLAEHDRATVAILDAKQADGCAEAPLRADGLRRTAADYLVTGRPSERYTFTDLGVYAAVTDALVTLRGRLNQQPGAPTGAATGADSVELIGSAAKEAWRQGIDVLLAFELQCVRTGETWSYTLETTRIFLNSVFSRGQLGNNGLDLRSFVEVEAEELAGAEQLDHALELTIDRSLGVDYVRLLHQKTQAPYRRDPELRVARYTGTQCLADAGPAGADPTARRDAADRCADRRVAVTARRIEGVGRPPVCARLDQHTTRTAKLVDEAARVYARGRTREYPLHLDVETTGRTNVLAGVDRTRLRVLLPGWYIVLAGWDGAAASDAICVQLTSSTSEVWGDFVLSGKHLYLVPRDNPEEFHLRARVGYTRYMRPWIGVGALIGYTYTRYLLPDGRPIWEDLDVIDESALRWSRHALIGGGHVELRTRFRRVPFDIRARVAPTVSLGVLSLGADDINPALSGFLDASGGKVRNIDLDFNLHFDLGASYDVGRLTINHLVMVGLDAVNDRLRQVTTGVRSNAGMFIGFGVGLGGSP